MSIWNEIRNDSRHALWHIALGDTPAFTDSTASHSAWIRMSHRGVQYLDKLAIPRKQKPYIFKPTWEIRFDAAFEQTILACADASRDVIQKRFGRSWMTPELIKVLLRLNRMGYAHSFEAWENGRLAGGVWGFQLGSFVSMNSMFHYVSNASKAAFCRSQMILRDRGFRMIDMQSVPDHLVNFGVEWIPQWRFEREVAELIRTPLSIADDIPCPPVPSPIQLGLPILRFFQNLRKWIRNPRGAAVPPRATC